MRRSRRSCVIQRGYFTDENAEEISKELGDVLWYIASIATELNISLAVIAEDNMEKLRESPRSWSH